jgi:apolipoprotein N-acyltransferase
MDVYPMAWLGLVAFAWLLEDEPHSKSGRFKWRARFSGGLRGFLFGLGTNLVALRFISSVIVRFAPLPKFIGPLALVVLAAFEASRWLTAALLANWLLRLGIPRVAAFAVGVYGGTFIPTMIPWSVACGVCPWPATVQLAELVGERGVAMLMALEAALVANGLRHASRQAHQAARAWGSAGALLAATLIYGAVRIHQVDALRAESPVASVALIEPAVPASVRWDETRAHEILARLTGLTIRAEGEGADLVVWPEAAYPFHMNHISRHAPAAAEAIVQPGARGPILTGLVMTGYFGKYNSAVIATSDGMISEPYDKMHLMWFGERVPFADYLPWLQRAFARGAGLRRGEHSVLLESGPVRAAVLNCLEDILPEAGREAMSVGPNLLVNLTNDAWFEGSAESELHLRLARLRTVELRRDLVRAVNLGPTTWVDAVGRVRARIAADRPGILVATPALLSTPATVYARLGDLPLTITLGAYALGAALWRRQRVQSRNAQTLPHSGGHSGGEGLRRRSDGRLPRSPGHSVEP